MASEIQPIARKVMVVLTYRTKPWADVLSHLLALKKTGCIELHCAQGVVEAVQWRENEK